MQHIGLETGTKIILVSDILVFDGKTAKRYWNPLKHDYVHEISQNILICAMSEIQNASHLTTSHNKLIHALYSNENCTCLF